MQKYKPSNKSWKFMILTKKKKKDQAPMLLFFETLLGENLSR